MSTQLYTGQSKWQRPNKCNCDKIPYRNEAAALAAAERMRVEFDTPFRAYKCPGTSRWHLATRGFHPRALKSRPRMMAWYLSARGVISWDGLLRELGFDPVVGRATRGASKVHKALRVFAELGLVKLDDPRPPYIKAAPASERTGRRAAAADRARRLHRRRHSPSPGIPPNGC